MALKIHRQSLALDAASTALALTFLVPTNSVTSILPQIQSLLEAVDRPRLERVLHYIFRPSL